MLLEAMITDIDRSGFVGLPLTGALAAMGQLAAVWSGADPAIAW